MKLLFDENLSFKLCRQLKDLFPGSSHVRLLGLEHADDHATWDYAKVNEFALATLDADFVEMAALLGPPPKSSKSAYGAAQIATRPAAALMCDLDHFKGINDRLVYRL